MDLQQVLLLLFCVQTGVGGRALGERGEIHEIEIDGNPSVGVVQWVVAEDDTVSLRCVSNGYKPTKVSWASGHTETTHDCSLSYHSCSELRLPPRTKENSGTIYTCKGEGLEQELWRSVQINVSDLKESLRSIQKDLPQKNTQLPPVPMTREDYVSPAWMERWLKICLTLSILAIFAIIALAIGKLASPRKEEVQDQQCDKANKSVLPGYGYQPLTVTALGQPLTQGVVCERSQCYQHNLLVPKSLPISSPEEDNSYEPVDTPQTEAVGETLPVDLLGGKIAQSGTFCVGV